MKILSKGVPCKVQIGRFCRISYGLRIFLGGNHGADWISTYPFRHVHRLALKVAPLIGRPTSQGDVHIGNGVWIGRDVTILSGVNVGDGAIIAANSHLVTNVASYAVVGGNPAKEIKRRFSKRSSINSLRFLGGVIPLTQSRK